MCWPPLITVLVDNNRARLQGMEVERERRELKLITASIWLSLAQLLSLLSFSLTLSPSVCVYFLQSLLLCLSNILLVFQNTVKNYISKHNMAHTVVAAIFRWPGRSSNLIWSINTLIHINITTMKCHTHTYTQTLGKKMHRSTRSLIASLERQTMRGRSR